MKRTGLIYLFVFVTIAMGSLCSCLRNTTTRESPNIVLIVVDDLGYADMSCTGMAEDVHTSNIDLLAQNGIRFTDAYSTSPIEHTDKRPSVLIDDDRQDNDIRY